MYVGKFLIAECFFWQPLLDLFEILQNRLNKKPNAARGEPARFWINRYEPPGVSRSFISGTDKFVRRMAEI